MESRSPESRQLLDLAADGTLDASQEETLRQELMAHPELARERRRLEALRDLLATDRVAVRHDFSARVMASLPVAPWDARGWKAWRFPLTVLVTLVALATGILALDAGRFGGDPSLLGALNALGDFAVTAMLAGAGLLSASWRGLGLALGHLLSGFQEVVFAVGLLALDAFLLLLLKGTRQSKGRLQEERSRRGEGQS